MTENRFRNVINGDVLFLSLCLVFFLLIFITSYDMEILNTYLLPRLLSGFGVIVTVSILIVNFNRILARAAEVKEQRTKRKGINVFWSVSCTTGYFFIMPYLGFMLTTFLAVTGFSFLLRLKNKLVMLVLAVGLPIVLHILFVSLLKVALPAGIIESLLF